MANHGYFGQFGGQFVPELLMPALIELEKFYKESKSDPEFQQELAWLLANYSGRPTPVYYAKNLTEKAGGAKIFLKREDLNHTGSHKLNNCLGQALLAKKMGKNRIIAETGAGQHGVATATVCALLGMECHIYMGKEDTIRQELNVFRMKLLGAQVIPVESGSQTLKDAVNETMREWAQSVKTTHYLVGSVIGPHPFPQMVRNFQSVIGREAREQLPAYNVNVPDYVVACVGGGSNSMGTFHPFIDTTAKLVGVEAGGRGDAIGDNSSSLTFGTIGVFHGKKTFFIQTENGQISEAHSIAAGLDYPGVGPEHSYLKESGRAEYVKIYDNEAIEAYKLLAREEGIIPALESSHAIAHTMKLAPQLDKDKSILVCLSGRGDKDIVTLQHD